MRQIDFREPKNPYDEKTAIYAESYEMARNQGKLDVADKYWGAWQRMIEKGTEWEMGMAQVRCEVLDAILAYEKRVGLR